MPGGYCERIPGSGHGLPRVFRLSPRADHLLGSDTGCIQSCVDAHRDLFWKTTSSDRVNVAVHGCHDLEY